VIKILYHWSDACLNSISIWGDKPQPAAYNLKEERNLNDWIEELVDKGNWTIIAATTEYIILQKRDYTPKALIKNNLRTCLKCGKDFDAYGKDIRHCSNCLSNL